jgi:peptide/nickel transport system substrate-binding protein
MDDRPLVEQQAELFRLASARRLSRREVMRRGLALGLSAPVLGGLLAACGGDDDDDGGDAAAPTATGAGGAGQATAPTTDATATVASDAPTPTRANIATNATATPGGTSDVTPWYIDDHPGPPQPGGTAVYLLYEEPDSMNYVGGQTSIAGQVSTTIIEPLAENGPDGSWVPILAEEIPTLENGGVSEDLLTITWKLREGVLWHDGEPFTADDVKFTWEAAISSSSAIGAEYDKIASIDTPDDLTVVISYSEFNVAYIDQFPAVLPRHATGDVESMLDWEFNRAPIGTGPFKWGEWESGSHVTVLKNEDYREEGKPYLDQIDFLIIPAEESRTAMMLEGDAHVMLWPSDLALAEFEGSETAKVRLSPGIWTLALRFNLSKPFDDDPGVEPPHPLFGDVRVREAIALAMDRERIVNEVLEGRPTLMESLFGVGWMQCEVEPFAYDPDAAAALLDEAGFPLGPDGIRVAQGAMYAEDGTKFEFTCNGYTGFSPNELAQLAVQEDLAKVGITMNIENQDFAIIFGTWADDAPRQTGDFDVLFYDGGFRIEPHQAIRRAFHPTQVPSEELQSGQNFWRWVREDVGEWIDAAGATPDIEKRREAYCMVADAMREDVVNIPILQFSEGNAYSTRIHGFTVSAWEWSTWDAENWWLEA